MVLRPKPPEKPCAATSERSTTSEPPATDDEIAAASLQFVRKVSGFTKPSKANGEEAFHDAVGEVAVVIRGLMGSLVTAAPAKDREVEAAKARARAVERFGKAG